MAWTKKITTKDGTARYKCFWYDPSGAQRSKTFTRFEDARRYERTVEVKKDSGSYQDPASAKITVEELATRFMQTTGGGLRPASRSLYRQQLDSYILPHLGRRSLASLGVGDVRTFYAALRDEGRGEATVAGVHRLLHRLFAFAMEEDRMQRNPATLSKTEKPRPEDREPRFLTVAEVERLADAIAPRYRTLVWTLAVAGLRIGEASGLRVEDLDLRANTIHVHRQGTEVRGVKALDQPTKGGKSRTVDIPASLSSRLADHLNTFSNRFDQQALVFTADNSGPVRQSRFRPTFHAAVARAGIEALRVHDLRHTAASLMSKAGYTLAEAAGQLGHSTTAMTARYSHIYDDARQTKAAALDALLGGER